MEIEERKDIFRRNTTFPYPAPVLHPDWEDPGRYGGIHERYAHPRGDFLKDGFAPPCMEITDFCTIEREGVHHLFGSIQAPGASCLWEGQHTHLIHATTADFVEWTLHRPVLFLDAANPWEESHVWPPYVFESEKDRYNMVYVGMDRDDCQSLCLATSNDLFSWRKQDDNPIRISGDRSWVRKRPDGRTRHMRDPHVLDWKGDALLYYTTLCDDLYSAVGVAVSSDLRRWEDLGPCFKRDASAPWLAESPLVFGKDGVHYLCVSMSPGISFFASDDPTDFHGRKEIAVRCVGVDRERIAAVEIVRRSRDDSPWLIGYYLLDCRRIFFATLSFDDGALTIRQVSHPDMLPQTGRRVL